ncbi:MAG TPA: hypothetical protein VM406_13895, partial [Noviherbaspirillum sp.]|nr:hypothetical protein [Noviherbaspirillum sp.]
MRIRESVLLSVRLALVAAALHAPLPALAGPVQLATSPLTNATTSNVLPNLMFILDNSGSMAWDFTPDYISETSGTPKATDKQCRDSGDDDNGVAYSGAMNGNTRVLDLCAVGDVPFMTSSMNRQYYNPAIRYRPGVNFRGESLASQTDPTKVQTDPYGKQRTNQLLQSKTLVDLTTEYPDRVWCTKNDPTDAELNNPSVCRRNSGYLYPDATYRYGRRKDTGGPDQRVTQTMLNGVLKVQGAPYYYSVVPSEYCDAADLRNCVAASAPTGNYTFPAHSRWCTDAMLTNCQAVRTASYTFPRYIGSPGATATAAVGTLRVRESRNLNVTSIRVNNVEILGSTVAWGNSNSNSGFAAAIAAQINTYTSNPNYTATVSGDTITLSSTVAAGAAGNGPISLSGTLSNYTLSSGGMTGGKDAINALAPYTFARTNIVPSVNSYPKAGGRTDCAGTTCTYAEEITNFANWYAYYRTRMQMMKTSATLAFKGIGDNFRVGFITISSQTTTGHYLPIDRFSSGAAGANSQKERWYSTLLNINPSGGTPLRSALSIVGRIYAGQKPVGNSDPVQYSCQQNFALLTSDGYWNTDTNSVVRGLDGNPVGNLDSDPSTRPVYEGPTATANTLADVAKYFYDTDLRDPKWGNCTGALGEGIDVCENNVFTTSTDLNTKQHMTTFTLGLGIDGTLNYTDDYMTATSGDFYRLKTGTGSPVVNWPIPVADTETAVDDLWHAAVNGGGIYFNAQDPTQLAKGLEGALASIGAKIGAGAAAATSTLNPVPGDNFAYVASYTTQKWHGNLEARSINLLTGVVSESAAWCVESVIAESCSGTVVSEDTGSSRAFYCVRQNVAEESCEGQFDGSSCKVQMATACTGTMSAKVSAS